MKKIKQYLLILLTVLLGWVWGASVQAAVFDPNYIISDSEIMDNTSMTLAEIESFLKSKGGFISQGQFANFEGHMKSMAEIIHDAANNYDCKDSNVPDYATYAEKRRLCKQVNVNPKFLIVLLQKEQSLIEAKNPTARQMDWAMGYGCPDNQACNPRWQGIGKQVNSAALQFAHYMEKPQQYTYKTGQTYTLSNAGSGRAPMTVTPGNRATAALYNYTPHVYWGNYNFFRIWVRYFSRVYPNNTLLQVRGEQGVWLIREGARRPFTSRGALTSRYDPEKIIQVEKSDLEKYPIGPTIKFPNYSLIKIPGGTIYLLVDDKKHAFINFEAFRMIGYNPEEIINGEAADLAAYEEGQMLTADSIYPMGALLQDKSTGGVYYVYEGTKAPLWDRVLLNTKFKRQAVQPIESEKLAAFRSVEPAIFGDGELLKSERSPGVYVIDQGQRRVFLSGEVFEDLGYKWSNIISVPEKILDLYPEGAPIAEAFAGNDITIEDPYAPPAEEEAAPIEKPVETAPLSVEDIITRMIYGRQ